MTTFSFVNQHWLPVFSGPRILTCQPIRRLPRLLTNQKPSYHVHYCCRYVRHSTHLSWHLTSVRVTIRNSVTKTYFLRAGDRSDQACDWNVIINTRVMIVWGLIESDYILPSPRVGRLSRLLASDWPEPHSPGFWLADNKTARCDSGQGQLPVIASLLPALSEPMRAQYWGHVTCTDQSEAGITLYCTDTRKQRQVWGRWGLIANEKIYNLPFLLWEEILFGKILLGSSFYQTSFQ